MPMQPQDHFRGVLAAVLCGAASGGRTFTGLAALALTAPPHAQAEPDRSLARPGVRLAIAVAALGELAADKLPQAPSRLAFPGSAGRALTAAACGVIAARRVGHPDRSAAVDPLTPPSRTPPGSAPLLDSPSVPAVGAAAVVAAAAWAVAGVRWRRWAAGRTGHDWVGALAEDAAVIALAAVGAGQLGD